MKTAIEAPDVRQPRIREAWLYSSLIMRVPFPASVGMLVELVAKPIPNTTLDSTPRNLANCDSNSLWTPVVPEGKKKNNVNQFGVHVI